MTLFQDGRIMIDRERYDLRYESFNDRISLVLINTTNANDEVARIVYNIDASYVLR